MTTFAQLSARLENFLRGWLLVLGLKEGLVQCATVCVKSVVIILYRLQYCLEAELGTSKNIQVRVQAMFCPIVADFAPRMHATQKGRAPDATNLKTFLTSIEDWALLAGLK